MISERVPIGIDLRRNKVLKIKVEDCSVPVGVMVIDDGNVSVCDKERIRSGRIIGFDRNKSIWELIAEALRATGIEPA